MLVKNITVQDHEILTRKSGFKVKKNVKHLGVILLIKILNYFRVIM